MVSDLAEFSIGVNVGSMLPHEQPEETTMSIKSASHATTTAVMQSLLRFDLRLLGLIGAVTVAATTVGLNA